MAESMFLVGSEQVQSAGYAMRDAADRMNNAASSMCSAMELFQRTLSDATTVMAEHTEAMNRLAAALEKQNGTV